MEEHHETGQNSSKTVNSTNVQVLVQPGTCYTRRVSYSAVGKVKIEPFLTRSVLKTQRFVK